MLNRSVNWRQKIVRSLLALIVGAMAFPSAILWANGRHLLSMGVASLAALQVWTSPALYNCYRQKGRGPRVNLNPTFEKVGQRGIVFCGGGGKGAYQLGVLRAFREFGINFDVFAGSSVGALNAAMYLSNGLDSAREVFLSKISYVMKITWKTPLVAIIRFYSFSSRHIIIRDGRVAKRRAIGCVLAVISMVLLMPDVELNQSNDLFSWFCVYVPTFWGLTFGPYILSVGLWLASEQWNWVAFSEQTLSALISEHIAPSSLAKMNTRLFVCVAQGTNKMLPDFLPDWPGRLYAPKYVEANIDTQNIQRWLLASASLPFGVLPNVKLNGDVFVDGGVADNAPILPVLEAGCEEIFIVHTNSKGIVNGQRITTDKGLKDHISRCIALRDSGRNHNISLNLQSIENQNTEFTARVFHLCPSADTGSLLRSLLFKARKSAEWLEALGYEDTKKFISIHFKPTVNSHPLHSDSNSAELHCRR